MIRAVKFWVLRLDFRTTQRMSSLPGLHGPQPHREGHSWHKDTARLFKPEGLGKNMISMLHGKKLQKKNPKA